MTWCISAFNMLEWTCWSLLMSLWWGWVNYFLCRWFHVCWIRCQLCWLVGHLHFWRTHNILDLSKRQYELLYFTPYNISNILWIKLKLVKHISLCYRICIHKRKLTFKTFIRWVKRRTICAFCISVALNSSSSLAIFSANMSCIKQ